MNAAESALLDGTELAPPLWSELAVENPQPRFRQLMDEHRVLRGPNAMVFTQMADIIAINRHKAVHATADNVLLMGARRPLIPFQVDGDRHRSYRRLLDPLVSAKQMADFASEIRELAVDCLEPLVARGEGDFFADFCVPLPSRVFLRLLGLPQADVQFLVNFKDDVSRPRAATAEERQQITKAASDRMYDYLERAIDAAKHAPEAHEGMLARFVTCELDGEHLTKEEISDLVYLLILAGLDTLSASFSCLIAWLARHPSAQQWLREDSSRLDAAIEELLRYESPVPKGARFATADLDVNGITIPAGTDIGILWACANLDESVFPNALQIDLGRQNNRHVAFASGFHRCLGPHLARIELRVVLELLLQRTSGFRIQPGCKPAYWAKGVRTVRNLVLTVEPTR